MKLKEAPNQVKIEVTQADINQGKQGKIESCAIARAVKRAMGDNPKVSDDIEITIGDGLQYYDIPKKAAIFIEQFDEDKKKVKPFTFVAKLKRGY